MKDLKGKYKILKKTERGGASVFIVILTVIILSIITMSFTRLIISEAFKTTNTDLSQSAYDSALAGIEDAKTALLKYHACLDKGYVNPGSNSGNECQRIIYNMQQGMVDDDCSIIRKTLGREETDDNHSTIIQETQTSKTIGNNADMLQAYTCVTIKEDLEDYRTTLNNESRLRIVPIRSDQIDSINRIKIKWFSQANLEASGKSTNYCNNSSLLYSLNDCNNGVRTPTVIAARLIQTDEWFNLSQLSVPNNNANNTDTGTLVLVPQNGGGNNTILASAWGESANKGENTVTQISCDNRRDWLCEAEIYLPETFNGNNRRNDANTYLLVSLPYGVPETDISITVYTPDGRQDFSGVQARVDSTGRANDLFRRVETRVELVDTYFAYPEFEITMSPNGEGLIDKTFWVTFDCWYTGSDNGGLYDEYEEILLDDEIIRWTRGESNQTANVVTCKNNLDYGGSSSF